VWAEPGHTVQVVIIAHDDDVELRRALVISASRLSRDRLPRASRSPLS
jgi:hypothetical protein